MHEHSFIRTIIKNIPDKEKVIGIEIELGHLVGIESGHLKEHLAEETGWDVVVKNRASEVRCSCGYSGEAKINQRMHDFIVFSCPVCDLVPEIIDGKDIKITRVFYK